MSRPQPYYDFEIAKICAWLKKHGYTMHVTLNCDVSLRKKPRQRGSMMNDRCLIQFGGALNPITQQGGDK